MYLVTVFKVALSIKKPKWGFQWNFLLRGHSKGLCNTPRTPNALKFGERFEQPLYYLVKEKFLGKYFSTNNYGAFDGLDVYVKNSDKASK